jgi:hypothetical protein
MTALMAACANKNESATIEEFELCAKKNEAVALLLMEATQKAGALDVQVNVVWSVCWEGGWAGGGGRGGEGGRGGGGRAFAQGTNICVYVLPQGDKKRSALHWASKRAMENAVAKLLSLGADAALKGEVRACSYMNTCKCSVHVCTFVNVLLVRISLSIMHHIFIIECESHIYIMLVKGIYT